MFTSALLHLFLFYSILIQQLFNRDKNPKKKTPIALLDVLTARACFSTAEAEHGEVPAERWELSGRLQETWSAAGKR